MTANEIGLCLNYILRNIFTNIFVAKYLGGYFKGDGKLNKSVLEFDHIWVGQ